MTIPVIPMNEKSAYTEYVVSTPTTDFAIGFDYAADINNIIVRIDSVPIGDTTYSATLINPLTVQITPAVPSGLVRFSRETDIDENLHKFSGGALFTATTVDKNFEQIRNSQQELRDEVIYIARAKELSKRIDAEKLARIDADNVLQANINSEAAIRLGGDNTLQTNINTEASTRIAQDLYYEAASNSRDITLGGRIDSEISNRALSDTFSIRFPEIPATILPTASSRAGKFLVFDGGGQPALASSSTGSDAALRGDIAAVTGAALVGTTGGRSQQDFNNLSIRPERFGAIGDGVIDDTAAVQAALNYATTKQKPLVCDGTYKLTSKITGTTLYGMTSIGSGKFIVTFDNDVFEFSGVAPNVLFSNLTFSFTVATATNKAVLLIKYQFHSMGLKVDNNNVNGFTACGWDFLRIQKTSGTGGFFGGFAYTNNRTMLINNDIDLVNADWVNSATFANNFKFYGNYGIFVRSGSSLYDSNIHGWWGQQCNGVIYCEDGEMNKCSIIGMLNWDTNTVALQMGVKCKGNTISKVYEFDIIDTGYMNKIVNDDYIYTSNVVTAIATTRFNEVALPNKASFAGIFNTVTATGGAVARNGIISTFGAGLKQNAYWIRTTTSGDSYLLDTLDKTVLGSDHTGKYDNYSGIRFWLDFSVGSTDMDDKSIKIGMGTAVTSATPVAGTFLTNIGGNFVIATFDTSNVATTLYSLGAIRLGRNQVQFIAPSYTSSLATTSAIHFNSIFVGRFTLDPNAYKRPIIQITSTTKVTTLGLLRCEIRNTIAANLG